MAMYAPIRDAFADLNNLIKDSQQWDERHAATQADNEFKQQMLTSQLEQRQFNNTMATQEMNLRNMGEARAADESAFRRMHSNRSWEVDKARAGEDTEFHGARMKKMKTEQENMAMELKEKQDFITARDGMLGEATKSIFEDPVAKGQAMGAQTLQKLSQMQTAHKKLDPNNNRNTVRRAIMQENINATKAELATITEGTNTPEEKVATWRAQADAARKLAPEWFSKNRTGEGNALLQIADDYDARADNEMARSLKGKKDAAARLAKDQWDKRFDRFASYWSKLDEISGNFLMTPAVQGRIAVAQEASQAAAEAGNLSDGQIFLEGVHMVENLENILSQKVEMMRANEAGLPGEEINAMVTAQVQRYMDDFNYVPDQYSRFLRRK